MRQVIDLTGQRFGRLVVVSQAERGHRSGQTYTRWNCVCDCGAQVVVEARNLKLGWTKSCGCALKNRVMRKRFGPLQKLGNMQNTPEYRAYRNMLHRCYTSTDPAHISKYQNRGITVCPEWRESFWAFYADMGPRPSPLHSLDRINNDGNYEPGNCRWATKEEQNSNRRDNVWIDLNGTRKTISQWAHEIGVTPSCVSQRWKRLMEAEARASV